MFRYFFLIFQVFSEILLTLLTYFSIIYLGGDFIEADRENLTEEDFTGGKLEYTFYIRRDKLHAGKNIGRIVFETPFEHKEIAVRVDNSSDEERRSTDLMQKKNIVSLMRTYIDFRLHRINTNGWISGSKNVVAGLLENDEDNPVCCLQEQAHPCR